MVCQPEEEKDESVTEETGIDGEPPEGRFWAGFFSGVLAAMACICVFVLGWTAAQRARLREERDATPENTGAEVLTDYHTLSKLDEVQNLIEQNYLREVDGDMLSSWLFKGIAAGLDDDYSNYYSVEELESVLDSSRGEYRGIGITLEEDLRMHELRVVEVYADGPADKAGMEPGDVLLAVDGEDVEGKGLSEVVEKIKSMEDTFLLKVFRPDTSEELELELACGDVEIACVEARMLEDRIGYIRLAEFTQIAVTQFEEALETLDGQGMEQLVVDLRDNPGGLLDSVCEILDEILPEGLIVYTEDKNGEREEYSSDADQAVTCEIAVLVNGDSASASEIFAGAVQDYGLGPVVGTQTYGKGVVQDTYTLTDGSAFKMTTKKYYTPKGQDIDGNGITPDYVVEEEPQSADATGAGTPGADETDAGDAESGTPGTDVTDAGDAESGMPGADETDAESAETGAESGEAEDAVLAKALEILRQS